MKSLANAVGAKTARACDSCVKRRARWYCAADDAFLCQSCDNLVHSANPLASRHERVRLKTASPATVKHSNNSGSSPIHEAATWHHGFTRKPRTPRGSGKKSHSLVFHDLVPEISVEDQMDSYEIEDQLICQVPVLDPMVAELFLNDVVEPKIEFPMIRSCVMIYNQEEEEEDNAESCLNGFFPTDMELEEFAADVETLLGRGLDTESQAMEELGLSSSFKIEKDEIEEDEEEEEERKSMDMVICNDNPKEEDGTVPFELSFDNESLKTYEEEAIIKNVQNGDECIKVEEEEEQKNVLMLRLNYDSVISTWGNQGPPWSSREPPELNIDIDINNMGDNNGGEIHQKQQYVAGCLTSSGFGDGGREARVSRYREKRRTRLFSKKIRYEVRKLNAEKRPRMKGRFVKRASLLATAS